MSRLNAGSLEHFAIEMLYGVGKAGLPLSLSVKRFMPTARGAATPEAETSEAETVPRAAIFLIKHAGTPKHLEHFAFEIVQFQKRRCRHFA